MQNLVGIIRTESELTSALDELDKLEERSAAMAVSGPRTYNPGWNLATDLPAMLTVSRSGHEGSPRPPRKPWRPHPRRPPLARPRVREGQPRAADRRPEASTRWIVNHSPRCPTSSAPCSKRSRTDGRRDLDGMARRCVGWGVHRLRHAVGRGRGRPRRHPPDPSRPGSRSGLSVELQGGQVRIVFGGDQRPSAPDVHDTDGRAPRGRTGRGCTHAHVSHHQRSGDRRVVQLHDGPPGPTARPPGARRSRRYVPDDAESTWPGARNSESASSASCARTSAT